MRKTKLVVSFLVIAAAILFAGNNDVYAGAGVNNPWGILPVPKNSTPWTGTLVISGQIANVSGLPAPGLPNPPSGPNIPPNYGTPLVVPGYQDLIVKIEFFVRLENIKKGFKTFSGLGRDNEGYYFFYALGDYVNGRIGEALNKFLKDKVYPNLPGGPYSGVLTSVTEDLQNVETQLLLDVYGRESLQPETPLYYNAKITVATY